MTQQAASELAVYQGQFGNFQLRRAIARVLIYRTGLMVAALSFAIERRVLLNNNLDVLQVVPPLFACFCLGWALAITIHIYLAPLPDGSFGDRYPGDSRVGAL